MPIIPIDTNTRYTGEVLSHHGGRQERDKGEARCHQPESELQDHVVQTGHQPMKVEVGAEAGEPFHVHRCNSNLWMEVDRMDRPLPTSGGAGEVGLPQ